MYKFKYICIYEDNEKRYLIKLYYRVRKKDEEMMI